MAKNSLMKVGDDVEALPGSARAGAGRAALATLGLVGHVPLWLGPVFAWAALTFRQVLAPGVAEFSLLTLTYLAPLLAGWLAFLATKPVLQREAKKSADRGRAAAAGASLAMTGTVLAVITAGHVYVGNPTFLEIGSQLLATALGVGYFGAWSFEAVAEARPEGDASRDVPALYQGFAAAGLSGPLLLAGGVAWGALSAVLGVISPWFLAKVLGGMVGPVPAFLLVSGIAVAGVAPLTYFAAKGMRRRFPRGKKAAIGMGLLLPPLLPLAAFAWRFFTGFGQHASPEAWWATLFTVPLLFGMAAGLHAGFAAAGLRGEDPRPALPAGKTGQALPAPEETEPEPEPEPA